MFVLISVASLLVHKTLFLSGPPIPSNRNLAAFKSGEWQLGLSDYLLEIFSKELKLSLLEKYFKVEKEVSSLINDFLGIPTQIFLNTFLINGLFIFVWKS